MSALECNYSLESLIFTLVSHNSISFIIFFFDCSTFLHSPDSGCDIVVTQTHWTNTF